MNENIDFCEVWLDDRAYTIKEEETIEYARGKEIKYIDDSGEIKTVSYFTMYADDHTHLDKIVYTYKNLYSYDYIYYKKFEKGTDE